MTTDRNTLLEIIKSFDTCMLMSKGADDVISARPMRIARIDEDFRMWFLTNIQNDQVGDILNDSQVTITAQNDHTAYVALTGSAHAMQNADIAKSLWSKNYDIWFPKGPTDPDLALIEFEPHHGEYWDSRGAKRVSYVLEIAKAYIKGEVPNMARDQIHAEVKLD